MDGYPTEVLLWYWLLANLSHTSAHQMHVKRLMSILSKVPST